VAGLIAFAVEKYGEAASLPLMRVMISKPQDEIAGIAQEARTFGVDSVAARKLGRFANPDNKENASIISTALTQTAFLDSTTLSKNMEESSFSFADVINGNATIYLVLPVDKLQTYGRWLRLMVSIGIRTIARNAAPLPLPVLFFLDEFGTIGKLSAVSQAFGLMAGLQMSIWIFVQDIIQLKRDYPDEWETFIGNASCVTASNVMDMQTSKYISDMLGVTTVERISETTAQKRRGGFLVSADPNFSRMADQTFARALRTPDEVRRLRDDYGLLLMKDALTFEKLYYFQERRFYRLARSDPYFPDPLQKEKEETQKIIDWFQDQKNEVAAFFADNIPPKISSIIEEFENVSKNSVFPEEFQSIRGRLTNEIRYQKTALAAKKAAEKTAKAAKKAASFLAGKFKDGMKSGFFKGDK
jgi:type IV secretion system protein VirD4